MLWCSLKNDLNILNIFFLNYLIKQANISAKCIEGKHILLLIGPSGAGKTTIMLRLLDYYLEKTKINDLATLMPNVPLKKLHSELITNPGANSTTKFIFSAQINQKYLEKINSENEKR
jgi:GTPase SAR1 family protein